MTAMSDALRALPSVDRLLAAAGDGAGDGIRHSVTVALAREVIEAARARVRDGQPAPELESLAHDLQRRVQAVTQLPVRRVINATGVVIHTNLGRAPLSDRAIEAIAQAARGYSNLEYKLDGGERGSRHEHCSEQLARLTGAADSVVVNNNAAAVLLTLAELASGREVIVSRGELVEIGGGFRIPDVLRQSGARLVEVGTTNRTYARDYAAAISPDTAALLRVHSSNFRVIGFTHRPLLEELVALARANHVPLIEDLGSGSLLDTAVYGVAGEPTVQASLAAGADLVCFSGDKLLGGPQAGIVVGRADLVQRLKRHPLMRAVRPDKMTITALAATLADYLDGSAPASVPVWRMMGVTTAELRDRAEALLSRAVGSALQLDLVDGASTIGGGALPEETLPTRLIRIQMPRLGATEVARRLRLADPPIVARIEADAVLLDLRTVAPSEDEEIARVLLQLGKPEPES